MNKVLKISLLSLAVLFFITFIPARAQEPLLTENGMDTQPLETVLQDILLKQNVSTIQELDCGKVTDANLERLGDAVMEKSHPGESHEIMDRMMGGEGSQTLRQMHINMGSSYLGCNGNNSGPGMMGMMGMMNMMGGSFFKGGVSNMMGWQNPMMSGSYGLTSLFGLLTWILVIVFLVLGIIYFWKNIYKSGKK